MQDLKFKHGFFATKLTLNQPFEADFEIVDRPRRAGHEPVQSTMAGRVHQDSGGRRREEYIVESSSGVSSTAIAISDPAVGTLWALDEKKRTVTVIQGPPKGPWPTQGEVDMRARSTEGTVDYEGLKCLIGFFRSEDGTSTEVRESVELREIVFHKDVGPAGEKTYRLFNVKRTEPDASLFVIPEGYKVIELRARS